MIKRSLMVGGVVILLLSYTIVYFYGVKVGVVSAERDVLEVKNVELQETIDLVEADREEDNKIVSEGIREVEVFREKVRIVEKKVPVMVGCDSLGPDYSGMYNELIRAIKTRKVPDGTMAP